MMNSSQVGPQMQAQMLPAGIQVYAASSVQHQSATRDHYAVKCVSILAITQITIGILCVILEIASMSLHATAAIVGAGIWCGILFIIAGSLGVWSSKSRTPCAIVSFMVMSIIAAIFTIAVITTSSISWGIEGENRRYYRYNHHPTSSLQKARIAVNACMVFLSVIEAIVAIVSSAMACHGICCQTKTPGVVLVPGQVQYPQTANGQQAMVVVPANQQLVSIPTAPQMMPGVTLQLHPQPNPVQGGSNVQPVQPPAYNPTSDPATPPPGYGYDQQAHGFADWNKEKH